MARQAWSRDGVDTSHVLTDDGALFIGQIKSFVIDEREIIPGKG